MGKLLLVPKTTAGETTTTASSLEIHGSTVNPVNAFFEGAYLRQVRSPVLQPTQQLIVWHSHAWDLKYPERRCQAIKVAIALLRFLKSEDVINTYVAKAKSVEISEQPSNVDNSRFFFNSLLLLYLVATGKVNI